MVLLAENTKTPPLQGVLMSDEMGPGQMQISPEPYDMIRIRIMIDNDLLGHVL